MMKTLALASYRAECGNLDDKPPFPQMKHDEALRGKKKLKIQFKRLSLSVNLFSFCIHLVETPYRKLRISEVFFN